MEDKKFASFLECFEKSFFDVVLEMTEIPFASSTETKLSDERTFSVIIGTTGKNNGRVLFEAGNNVVKRITENMNGEPLSNIMDMYLFLAEFNNIFCGNAVTKLNNLYKGSDLRLTPPAVFAGSKLEIITPNIHSASRYFSSEFGLVHLNIGFEGA